MNPLSRRRTAVGALAGVIALFAGLVVAPNVLAAANGLSVSPSLVVNTETRELTFTGTDTQFQYGATADFVGFDIPARFSVTVPPPGGAVPPTATTRTGKAVVNFSDLNTTNNDTAGGVGRDGPVDAGTYGVTTTGNVAPNPAQAAVSGAGGGSDSCTSCFLVQAAGPVAVTSVAPTSQRPNTTANASVLGNNFERGSIIEMLLPGSTQVDTTIQTNLPPRLANGDAEFQGITTRTQLRRQFKIDAAAVTGPRDVRVRNLNGNSAVCAGCFNVAGASLTSVNPPGGSNRPDLGPVAITFTGTNVVNGTPFLEFIGVPGGTSRSALTIEGTNPRDYTGTSITADFDLRNAAPGDNIYQPVVRGADGFNACDICRFTVTQREEGRKPTLTSMDSDTATAGIQKDIKQGETKDFFVTGTNFSKGAGLTFTPAGLTVSAVQFVSPVELIATVTAANPSNPGPRDAVVTLTDGQTSNTCTACVNVTANASGSPSASPTGSSSASPSATATSTMSGSASPSPTGTGGCPTEATRIRINTRTINATGLASVTVTGARPNAGVELQGYSQNHEGDMTFANDPTPIDRVGRADSNGNVTFSDLRPASNTRLRARQVGCPFGGSGVIEVRAQETLEVRRTGTRSYTFSGRSIPAREGGLIVSLYRIVGKACAPGVEPKSCPGERFIGQARAASLGSPGEGRYSIRITFPSRDQNVRDEFVVKTGRDAQNAPGRSNARSLLIN